MPGNGLIWSVTEILQAAGLAPDYRRISPDVLAHATARGTALHAAIQYYEAGELDETSLHPDIQGPFASYLAWRSGANLEVIASECELLHPQWAYVGHPDMVAHHDGRRCLIDFKLVSTIDRDYCAYQAAGYKYAWEALHPKEPIAWCLALQIFRDGSPAQVHPLSDAGNVFQAALVIVRERLRTGKLRRDDND